MIRQTYETVWKCSPGISRNVRTLHQAKQKINDTMHVLTTCAVVQSAKHDEVREFFSVFTGLCKSDSRPSDLEMPYTYRLRVPYGFELRQIPTLVHSVFIAAIKWNDVKLWQGWLTFCVDNNHISLFRPPWMAMSASRFGFEPVKAA